MSKNKQENCCETASLTLMRFFHSKCDGERSKISSICGTVIRTCDLCTYKSHKTAITSELTFAATDLVAVVAGHDTVHAVTAHLGVLVMVNAVLEAPVNLSGHLKRHYKDWIPSMDGPG